MDGSGSFKVPSMIAQDLAIIMGMVDPPESTLILQEKREPGRGQKRKVSPNIVSKADNDVENDAFSSFTESEDEVEAQIARPSKRHDTVSAAPATRRSSIASSSPDTDESDSLSSSCESSSTSSLRLRKQTRKGIKLSTIHTDSNDDGVLAPATYIPTAHEVPPTAIPLPPLPDPSTLPQEKLEFVGEIVTVLSDSVTVRRGGLLNATPQNRRDAVLDEGSLLLLDDRSPVGYIWETFGPTTLPHYLVRIKRRESTGNKPLLHASTEDASENPQDPPSMSEGEKDSQSTPSSTTASCDYPDFNKLTVSRAVYHIPSLSKFVFPGALAGLKGSDASNLHDEEPGEHELDFSDDEAEAKYKRHRKGSLSRAPSQTPFSDMIDGEGDSVTSTVGDEACSLYGASPYDFEDVSPSSYDNHAIPSSPSDTGSPIASSSLTSFEDAAIRDALMHARNSRHRRNSSVSISRGSVASGLCQPREQDRHFHDRGDRGGGGRGNDRRRSERGRGQNSNGQPRVRGRGRGRERGRGRGRGQEAAPDRHSQGSYFSFEEYDPHMPRPPSPTSLAIAHATGQWADGTPFPYDSTPAVNGSDTRPAMHFGQVAQDIPGHMTATQYAPGPYSSQGNYDSTVNFPQSLEYQSSQVPNYGVAPHINPRFAQAFGLSNATQALPALTQHITLPHGSLNSHSPSETNEAKPGF